MQIGHKIVTDCPSSGFYLAVPRGHCSCVPLYYNDNGDNDDDYCVNDDDNSISFALVACGFAAHCTDGQF